MVKTIKFRDGIIRVEEQKIFTRRKVNLRTKERYLIFRAITYTLTTNIYELLCILQTKYRAYTWLLLSQSK
jgi:hypothetical protein